MKSKIGITLIAALLVGAGVFAFVSYSVFDAIGFGRVMENEDEFAITWGTNETMDLTYVPESKPTITFWNGTTTYNNVNGTVPATNVSWVEGMSEVYIYSWKWDGSDTAGTQAYGKDTVYLRANYTGVGSSARGIAMPVVILVAVFAIIVVAASLVKGSTGLSGKSKKW